MYGLTPGGDTRPDPITPTFPGQGTGCPGHTGAGASPASGSAPGAQARSEVLWGSPARPKSWGHSPTLPYAPPRPATHRPLGPPAHVLWAGPSDGHAGLPAAPQPVSTLVSPRALGPPGAPAGAGEASARAPVHHGVGHPAFPGWAETPAQALTGPPRCTSRSRGPGSRGTACSFRSSDTPAREAGTPGDSRAVSRTAATGTPSGPRFSLGPLA